MGHYLQYLVSKSAEFNSLQTYIYCIKNKNSLFKKLR